MSQYGIPYMGSKSKICEKLCSIFPAAENFYDLFGGGFSVSHCILQKRKDFRTVHYNEIRPGMAKLIEDAIAGKYSYDVYSPTWITREEFFAKKESDPLIKILWSFGNNGETYLFGKDIENYKRSLHNAIIFNDFDVTARDILKIESFPEGSKIKDRRFFLRNRIYVIHGSECREQLQQLQQLERLQQLQQLERLQQLQQRLVTSSLSYELVPILPDSVIYCDIPYFGTGEYDDNKAFNHKRFFEWVRDQSCPVFVSEYMIKQSHLFEVWSTAKRSLMAAGNKGNYTLKEERLYANQTGVKALMAFRKSKLA